MQENNERMRRLEKERQEMEDRKGAGKKVMASTISERNGDEMTGTRANSTGDASLEGGRKKAYMIQEKLSTAFLIAPTRNVFVSLCRANDRSRNNCGAIG